MLQLLGDACICRAFKQRMLNYICLGWAAKYLLHQKFGQASAWKFVIIIQILRNVRPTRKSVPTNKRFRIPKIKFKGNVEDKNYHQRPRF